MKKLILLLSVMLMTSSLTLANYLSSNPEAGKNLETFVYEENFESRELNAWASYPLWQDTAYDPNLRVGTIAPGDPNISLIQKVTPYTSVESYAGAQKNLDMYLMPGSTIKLRYYLKTQLRPEFFKIRIAGGSDGKIDFTISNPKTNSWEWAEAAYDNFIQENPKLSGKKIKVNALAVLAKFPNADPAMPIYLGLDDIAFKGARLIPFEFIEPKVFKLSEWEPYIPQRHYFRGDIFSLKGKLRLEANRVEVKIVNFADRSRTIFKSFLNKVKDEWRLEGIKLPFPEGLYLAELSAYQNKDKISSTEFTIYIEPKSIGRNHPRLWFDSGRKNWLKARLRDERFKGVVEAIKSNDQEVREKNPVDSIFYDIDQFPSDEPLIGNVPRSIYPWFERIRLWQKGLFNSSLAYSLLDDKEAGEYGKALLLKLSQFPFWVHPWFKNRGQHIYYPVGELGMDVALSYDLLYELMDEGQRKSIQEVVLKNIIIACHQGYVEDNLVTSNTSNWVAHITGSSLMSQAAIYGDRDELGNLEPYFSGVMMKIYDFIQKAFGRDGGYGESFGYNEFTMLSLSKALPAVENVFKVDLSANINGSYRDIAWQGLIKDKLFFHFGDSGGNLGPLTNWAWLLAKNKDPLLGWLYHFLKKEETFADALYETEIAPRKEPFDQNPVTVFKDIGTTVFKSGWEKDDFVLVMRSGAFFNHQHLDQGTCWLADKGSIFIGERNGSTYYDDPIYQSHYTQPIAHSTILVDHNSQSQRVGDPLRFAEGFDDHAFIYHFLDGSEAAFSCGDIGRLYWGKVRELRRNVLYLKPRTILMLDTIIPAEKDIDVTLLYQTDYLKDIQIGQGISTITKGKNVLFIKHLYPERLEVKAEETPHYINTLKNEMPLTKEGMLTITARTSGEPLVIANLLGTEGVEKLAIEKGDGFISGKANGKDFAFSIRPNRVYKVKGLTTDALALTWDETKIFAALCTSLDKDGKLLVRSEEAVTAEIGENSLKYYLGKASIVSVGVSSRPSRVTLNGKATKNFKYDEGKKIIVLSLPEGEGFVSFE